MSANWSQSSRAAPRLYVDRGTGGRSRAWPTGFGGMERTSGRDPFGLAGKAGKRGGTPISRSNLTTRRRTAIYNLLNDAARTNAPGPWRAGDRT